MNNIIDTDTDIMDEMYDFETEFDEEEKYIGNYYIGIYVYMKDKEMLRSGKIIEHPAKLQLGMAISNKLFFKYEYKYVYQYLYSSIKYCPYSRFYNLNVNIMKLNIINDIYVVEVKTYWIRLIQRHWRNIINKRKVIINKMKTEIFLRSRELGKKTKLDKMPKLVGMLSMYSNKKD